MKYFALILIVMFFSCSKTNDTEKNSLDCEKFHVGKFINIAPDSSIVVIERTDSTQIERTKYGTNKYRISWSSDCEYILIPLELNVEISKKRNIKKYFVKIISVDSTKYTFEIRVDEDSFVYKGEMEKVE